MAIPNDAIIQEELLRLLGSSPDHRLHASEAYKTLADLHPELTSAELTDPYRNSVSHWANRVQFARLHLVNRGLLYKAGAGPRPRSGVWILTERGRERALDRASEREREVRERVAADLAARESEDTFLEGRQSARLTSHYERNPELRTAAVLIHGETCAVCGFNFEETYGEHGRGFIEVHHLVPVSSLEGERAVDPNLEMSVLCSNCHRMIHRRRNSPLSLDQLRALVHAKTSAV